ncbi:MAG: hypothetical protein H0X26_01220 [Alphaproteobacteria bacterium]|nr:hypothetical protein [Alphaproteobacteria bacterium]
MGNISKIIALSFFCSFFVFLSTSWAMIKTIDSIEAVENKVRSLHIKGVKAEEICVVFDFHGVIVDQRVHGSLLTLKGEIKKTLQYLKEMNVPSIIATAWDDFNAVITAGIVPLGLQDYFDVNPNHIAAIEEFILGQNSRDFVGYQNGRVLALKKADSQDLYFRKKAFTVEVAYPSNDLKYILFVDDSLTNVEDFRKDAFNITHNGRGNFKKLVLYKINSQNTNY